MTATAVANHATPATRTARARARAVRLTRPSPLAVHLATLVVSFAAIAVVGRHQWFYFDEWFFLIPDGPSLLTPHTGHLSIFLDLWYHLLRSIFGIRHYWPYLGSAVVSHLVLAHLLWRVMLRARVDPWIATSLSFLMMLFGTGAENILWGFQVGYIGAIACGVGTALLVTRERLGVPGQVGVAALTALALGTSGTSLPVVAVSVVLALRFRGLRTTAVMYAVPVAGYLLWYVTTTKSTGIATPSTLEQILTFVPRYVARQVAGTFDTAIPLPGIGAVLVACLLAWFVVRAPRLGRPQHALPAALLVAGLLFAALTAYSRFGIGLKAATSSRYLYYVMAMALPAIGSVATALVRRAGPILALSTGDTAPSGPAPARRPSSTSASARVVVGVLVLAATAYNLGLLITEAHKEQRIEQGTRREVYASLAFALAYPDVQLDPHSPVDSYWAHALSEPQLLKMHAKGWVSVGHYGRRDLLTALTDVAVRVVAADDASCPTVSARRNVPIPAGPQGLVLDLASVTRVTVQAIDPDGLHGRFRPVNLPAGPSRFLNTSGRTIVVNFVPAGSGLCS